MCFFNPSIDRSIGAKWKYNPPERAIFSDNKTLRLSSPAPFKNFNDEVFEAATHMLSILQNKALLTWDKNYVLHPDIAYNWYAQDWDVYGDGSQISEYGNITFWLYDNAYWNTYTDINGIAQPKHRVDGYDFKFAVDLMQMEEIHVKSEELFQIDHLDVHTVKNSTGGNWDGGAISFYIKPGRATPMDSHLIGQQLTPMPVHILNVSQTVRDLTGNPYELNAAGFGYNPQFSTIWQHWSTNENGYSGVGPYEIQDFNTEIMDNGRVMVHGCER